MNPRAECQKCGESWENHHYQNGSFIPDHFEASDTEPVDSTEARLIWAATRKESPLLEPEMLRNTVQRLLATMEWNGPY